MNRFFLGRVMAILGLLVSTMSVFAWPGPLGNAITYQGQLKQNGSPVSGPFDLECKLFDALTAGTLINTVPVNSVPVTDGLFTIDIDFGTGAFDGNDRFLEIGVRPTGNGAFTALSPRQKLNAAPYAQFAKSASISGTIGNQLSLTNAGNTFVGSGSGLTGLNASNITTGTIGNSLLSGTYGNSLTLNNVSNIFAGTFSGSGAGLASLNASNVSAGNLASARLPTGGAWALSSALNLDSNTLVIEPASNRIGLGVTSPDAPLHIRFGAAGSASVLTNAPLLLERNGDNFLSMLSPAANPSGVAFGRPGSTLTELMHGDLLYNDPAAPNGLEFRTGGNINRMVIDSAGKVGIGTTAPAASLQLSDPSLSTLLVDRTGGSQFQIAAQSTISRLGTINAFPLRMTTGGNDRVTIDTAGNVGVGTVAPETNLHVVRGSAGPVNAHSNAVMAVEGASNSYVNILTPDDHESGLLFGQPTLGNSAGGVIFNNSGNADGLLFRTGGNLNRMTITSAGDVGIGTTNPAGKFHVSAPAGDDSVVLPTDSISPAETLGEPGVAARINKPTVSLPNGSTFTLCTRTITCPTDGYVVAIGTTEFIGTPLFDKAAILGIMTSDTEPPADQDYLVRIRSFETSTVQRVVSVTAGAHTFYFQAVALDDDIVAEQRKLTLMFFPTAYGSVDDD